MMSMGALDRRIGAAEVAGLAALCLIAGLCTPHAVAAQRRDDGWTFTGRFTTVFTGGNSESNTFGLATTVRFQHQNYEFKFETGAIRTDSGVKERRAIGSDSSFVIEEETIWDKTAEAYFARARYDRDISEAFLVFIGTDWLRNTFSGIDSRFLLAVGAGNTWAEADDFRFKTDMGLTYTFQQDVVTNPFAKTNFPGVRASWDLMRRFTTSTRFVSTLVADLNIDNTDDLRADFKNALSIAVTNSLAFEPSLQLLWRNDPALKEVDLFAPDGSPTGSKVRTPLEKLDTFFNVALVVTL